MKYVSAPLNVPMLENGRLTGLVSVGDSQGGHLGAGGRHRAARERLCRNSATLQS